MNFITLDWKQAKFRRTDYKEFETLPEKPKKFSDMIEISRKLSKDLIFCRVDLYEIKNHIYFSELTFAPGSGFAHFKDQEDDKEIGDYLRLPR